MGLAESIGHAEAQVLTSQLQELAKYRDESSAAARSLLTIAGQAEYDQNLVKANLSDSGNKILEKARKEVKAQIIDMLEDFIVWREYSDKGGVYYLEGSIQIKEESSD